MRSIFKKGVGLFGILIVVVVAAGTFIFFYRLFTHRRPDPGTDPLADSITRYQIEAKLNKDSGKFHFDDYAKQTIISDSLTRDSVAMDSMRTRYSATLRAKIGARIQDSTARQRH